MKLLSKKTSGILKFLLLFNVFYGGFQSAPVQGRELVSSDRFLIKVLDRTISLQDFQFQLRNLKGLNCVYPDALVINYFEKDFIQNLQSFLKNFPEQDEEARKFMHQNGDLLKKIRHFFKMLRYTEDQKTPVSPKLMNLIQESVTENKCNPEILYKDTLKTNFINLLQMELYLRSRYGGQLKAGARSFTTIRSSIDLFVESLDKQFLHEYYW
jgi:hypothetical protein